MLKRFLIGLAAFTLASGAAAQYQQPATLSIDPTKTPEVLQVLDAAGQWAPIGYVDPAAHLFSAMGQYATHAALVAGANPQTAWTIAQRAFGASGYGAATYDWNPNSYCPGGTSGSPVTADGNVCILPSGWSASTAGRYLLRISGALDLRQIGMVPDGTTDNSQYLSAWMAAITPTATNFSGYSSVFTGAFGQNATYYYFANPIDVSRGGRLSCGVTPPANTTPAGLTLLIAAGQDGFINDAATTSPDGKLGVMEIDNCTLRSMGFSFAGATLTVGGGTITGATLPAFGSVQPSWGPGDGVIAAASGPGLPSNGTSLTQATTNGNTITASGGFPAAVVAGMAPIDLTSGGAAQGFYGGNPVVSCAPAGCGNAGNTTLTLTSNVTTAGAADKVRFVRQDLQLLPTGAYIDSCTNCNGAATLQLHPGFEPLWVSGTSVLYQLPAALRYTINTTAGSPAVTVTSGPRKLVQGDMLWGPGIPFGTIVSNESGSIPTETVNLYNVALAVTVNATQTATGAYAWAIPSCRNRRAQSAADGVSCVGFPIGLKMICGSNTPDFFNCTNSHDYHNLYSNALINRLISGNNTGASDAIGEEFLYGYLFDMVDAGQVGVAYTNINSNSAELGSSLFTVAFNNAQSNVSVLLGGYYGNQVNQPVVLPNSGGQAQWGVPPNQNGYGGNILVINPSAGFASAQKIGASVLLGRSYFGNVSYFPFVNIPYVKTGQSTNQDGGGEIALVSGTAAYTLQNPGTSHPICQCWSQTNKANTCSITYNGTTGITFTGTGTDTVEYQCTGRN